MKSNSLFFFNGIFALTCSPIIAYAFFYRWEIRFINGALRFVDKPAWAFSVNLISFIFLVCSILAIFISFIEKNQMVVRKAVCFFQLHLSQVLSPSFHFFQQFLHLLLEFYILLILIDWLKKLIRKLIATRQYQFLRRVCFRQYLYFHHIQAVSVYLIISIPSTSKFPFLRFHYIIALYVVKCIVTLTFLFKN